MNKNKKVVVSLQGSLENGEIFEQTPEDHPVLIVLGHNNIFPKLEEALEAMRPGESRTIPLAPEEAYGPHHQELVQTIDLSVFNNSIQPQPGMILSLNVDRDGRQEKVPATVLNVADEKVTIDYNHPLAGKTVVYTLTMHEFPEE
ncbi:MAG: peptidylprolyl isomerase [Desulfobulbaceae bacterium]|nr:peptidylprolyl isomerase [Desulfobulbaceae bacterium]